MSGRILWHRGRSPNRVELVFEQIASLKPMAMFFTSTGARLDRKVLEATKGRVSLVLTLPVLMLHTTGAKSGQERVTPLLYVQDGDRIILVAGNGGRPPHPGWYHNLRADPKAAVEIKGRRQEVIAREAEGAEREEDWRKATEMYRGYEVYQGRRPERRFPVMVLEPAG
jgi:deazaflavin-dependent oxidoreductase (nitroreductase family)